MKNIYKAEKNGSDGKPKKLLIDIISKDEFINLLENIMGIIFDQRTFPNFVVNALNILKNLVDLKNRNAKPEYNKSHSNLLQKILQKIVLQMKIIRDNHAGDNRILRKIWRP